MSEAVRLVIWDLDGVFWAGTLTEGGHTYDEDHHNIVLELAKRGIVSSICSKNDFETVKAILVEKKIWDYFVFPSIDWTPKGPRLRQMVEDIGLRPETILFLDDNHLNRNEAIHFVPGIRTVDDTFIPSILGSPLFKGKDDRDLTRLNQYKVLQARKSDETVAADNSEFLRSCDIRVTIEHNVETHLDRVIELINRTNQLNFTKERLPEDGGEARRILLENLQSFAAQAGLIRVTDKYGDYGYSGFYLAITSRTGRVRLRHFCFSCRILNMGVEQWVYERLGRPELDVVGEVFTDLTDTISIDWISTETAKHSPNAAQSAPQASAVRVFIRGACAVSPLSHYFQIGSQNVVGEFQDFRERVQVRRDHSLMLQYSLEPLSSERMEIFAKLGFAESDFFTAFPDASFDKGLRILCNWADGQEIVYRHKKTGLPVPYSLSRPGNKQERKRSRTELSNLLDIRRDRKSLARFPERTQEALLYLQENFYWAGRLSGEEAYKALDAIIGAVPADSPLFLIAAPERDSGGSAGADAAHVNRNIACAMARHPKKIIIPVDLTDFAASGEQYGSEHFHRSVYLRLFQSIWAQYQAILNGEQIQIASKWQVASGEETRTMPPIRSPKRASSLDRKQSGPIKAIRNTYRPPGGPAISGFLKWVRGGILRRVKRALSASLR